MDLAGENGMANAIVDPGVLEKIPAILKELPDHPIAATGLIIIVFSILCYFLFGNESSKVRLAAFLTLIIGSGVFGWAAFDYMPSPVVLLDECNSVANPGAVTPVIAGTKWCGGPGATRTTIVQAMHDAPCQPYTSRSYASLSQNDLFNEAVRLAKEGKKAEALDYIDTCQCHNPPLQLLVKAEAPRVYCWLRLQ
jgi:hypothetical protein